MTRSLSTHLFVLYMNFLTMKFNLKYITEDVCKYNYLFFVNYFRFIFYLRT